MFTFNGQIISYIYIINNKLYCTFLWSNIFIFFNCYYYIDYEHYLVIINKKYFMQSHFLYLLYINFELLYSYKFIKNKFEHFIISNIFFKIFTKQLYIIFFILISIFVIFLFFTKFRSIHCIIHNFIYKCYKNILYSI